MKKIILLITLLFSLATAGLVDAIAIIVNDTPITLKDIDDTIQNKNLTKIQAVEMLVDKILYENELKKHNIAVDIFDIDNQIALIAKQNNMNLIDFKTAVKQQQDYEQFKEQIKKQLIHQKLVVAIAKGKLNIATKDDIQIYYNAHKQEYKIAKTIEAVIYMSKNKQALEIQKLNPMQQNDQISTQAITLEQNKLPPQLKYIINLTPQNQFSSIFVQNRQYNMFFIKNKKDIKTMQLKDVQDKIFQAIMKQRENKYLKEYFDTIKLTADIKVLR
jgi:hypothetical protein